MRISNIKSQISNNLIGSKGGTSSKASTMAELMASSSVSKTFVTPKKGDSLKGIITKLTSQEITVDIQAKSEAIVLEKDPKILKTLLTTLKVGQEVTISVLNPESDTGNPVVSLRRFVEDILWKELDSIQKNQKKLPATITEVTRGGFLVDTQMGFSGFLPNSQVSFPIPTSESQGQEYLGKKIDVYLLEQQRATKKIIFTQKLALSVAAFAEAIKDLKIGQKVTGVVSNVTSFGIFLTLPDKPNIDAFIHISEVSWENIKDLQSMYSAGGEIEAVVIRIDKEQKRVELSIKKLTADPFQELTKGLSIDQKVQGEVVKVDEAGVSIEIVVGDEVAEGLIRKEKIPVGQIYELGQEVSATVSQIDTRRRKVYLLPVMLRKTVGYR